MFGGGADAVQIFDTAGVLPGGRATQGISHRKDGCTGAPALLAQQPAPGESAQTEALQAAIRKALSTLRTTRATTRRRPNPTTTAGVARIAQEFDAVVSGTAQATQKILAAAEEIDQAADNLSVAPNNRIEQGVA